MKTITSADLAHDLRDVLNLCIDAAYDEIDADDLPTCIAEATPLAGSDYLTDDEGVVVTTTDGSRFIVTVTQAR